MDQIGGGVALPGRSKGVPRQQRVHGRREREHIGARICARRIGEEFRRRPRDRHPLGVLDVMSLPVAIEMPKSVSAGRL